MRTGCPTHIITRIPHQRELARGADRLSREARRRKPRGLKDKPFVERFIGTLQTECLDYHFEPMGAAEMQEIIDGLIFKYENVRPYEALGFLTSSQFEDMFY